ncbi:MAG: hypothetical protein NC110_07930, partial [Ruminococcus sp.]|nr:hypothetical protein [Ruminococcus sp.]
MPDEYSYNDFMQMQQQAIDRVREIQKKASPTDSTAPEPLHPIFAEEISPPKPLITTIEKP